MEDLYPYNVWEVRRQDPTGTEGAMIKSAQYSFERKATAFLYWLMHVNKGEAPLNIEDAVITTNFELEKWPDFDSDVRITYTFLGNDGVTLEDEYLNCLIAKVEEHLGHEFTADDLEPGDVGGLPGTTGTIKLGPLDIVWTMMVSEEFAQDMKR